MASGYCLDTWHDWRRSVNDERRHYDARVARSCRSSYSAGSGWSYEPTNVGIIGVQKQGVCYGPNNNTVSPDSKCAQPSDNSGTVATVNPNLPNNCTRSWRLTSSGSTVIYDGGGSPTSCSS